MGGKVLTAVFLAVLQACATAGGYGRIRARAMPDASLWCFLFPKKECGSERTCEEDAQHTLTVGSQTIDAAPVLGAQDAYDYGLGLGLSGTYGTVSISYSNGTKMNVTKVDGSESYKALLKTCSLEASQHIHPPYQGWDDPEIDWPRQRQRQLNKAHGLPASEDVGVISAMISNLATAAELRLGHNITAALAATPNLVALYQEDVADAFEYSALQSLDSPWDRDHVYHETGAAGLCWVRRVTNTLCAFIEALLWKIPQLPNSTPSIKMKNLDTLQVLNVQKLAGLVSVLFWFPVECVRLFLPASLKGGLT